VLNGTHEILVDIPGYENLYQVSNLGYVTNGRKVLKTYRINSGYECLKLHKEGNVRSFLLHRLVAENFCSNPHNKPEVNHIDGNKANCAALNLEWMTSSENKQHAIATGLKVYNMPSKGKKLSNKSKYHNVVWDSSRSKWVGVVRHEKKNHYQKRFDTEEQAALHVNWILDTLGLNDRPRNHVP
jgi:hypothetical protein